MKRLIIITIALMACGLCHGQDYDTLGVKILFRQGSGVLDMDFAGNGESLERFVREANGVLSASAHDVEGIVIETSASPEGSIELNERLSVERAHSIRTYLLNRVRLLPSQIRVFSLGVDWVGLSDLIARYDAQECPWRDDILSTVFSYTEMSGFSRQAESQCQARLKALDGGKAWQWMLDNVFETLRSAGGRVRFIYRRSPAVYVGGSDTTVIIHNHYNNLTADQMAALDYVTASYGSGKVMTAEERPRTWRSDSLLRRPKVAFRSNLLMPLSNVGLEIPLGNRVSLEADWYSPWLFRPWMNAVADFYRHCVQGQAFYLGPRIWLGGRHSRQADPKYRMLGHSIGIGAAAVHYDMCFNYKGEQGDAVAFGIDYMYAMPLGSRGRVRMEFTAGVGGWWCKYRRYRVEPSMIIYSPDGKTPVSTKLLEDGPCTQRYGVVPFRAAVHIVVPIFAKEREVGHE